MTRQEFQQVKIKMGISRGRRLKVNAEMAINENNAYYQRSKISLPKLEGKC